MLPRTIALLTLVALSVTGWSVILSSQRRRLAGRSAAKPEPLQTWEGEGGGLPNGGPGITIPATAIPATAESSRNAVAPARAEPQIQAPA
jgi:hypothetical protein